MNQDTENSGPITEIQELLSGKMTSADPFVDYLATQYRGMRVEYEASGLAVKNLKVSLGKEMDRQSFLRGGMAKYREDAIHWLAETKKVKTVIPEEAPETSKKTPTKRGQG